MKIVWLDTAQGGLKCDTDDDDHYIGPAIEFDKDELHKYIVDHGYSDNGTIIKKYIVKFNKEKIIHISVYKTRIFSVFNSFKGDILFRDVYYSAIDFINRLNNETSMVG